MHLLIRGAGPFGPPLFALRGGARMPAAGVKGEDGENFPMEIVPGP